MNTHQTLLSIVSDTDEYLTGLGVSNGPETTRNGVYCKSLCIKERCIALAPPRHSEGPLEVRVPLLGPNRGQTLLWGGASIP